MVALEFRVIIVWFSTVHGGLQGLQGEDGFSDLPYPKSNDQESLQPIQTDTRRLEFMLGTFG